MAKEVENNNKKNKRKKEDKSLEVVEEKKSKNISSSKIVDKEDKEDKEENGKTKYYFEMWEVIVIMVITALFGLFIGSFLVYKNYNNDKVVCRDVNDDVNSITTVYTELLSDYYGDIDKEKLIDSSINGMINGLDDPYALYISDENALLVEEELDGSYVGIGIEVVNDNNNVKVVTVYGDSPAFKAGIVPDDIIVSIDGVKITFENIDELMTDIKNSKNGSTKIINLLRNGTNIR